MEDATIFRLFVSELSVMEFIISRIYCIFDWWTATWISGNLRRSQRYAFLYINQSINSFSRINQLNLLYYDNQLYDYFFSSTSIVLLCHLFTFCFFIIFLMILKFLDSIRFDGECLDVCVCVWVREYNFGTSMTHGLKCKHVCFALHFVTRSRKKCHIFFSHEASFLNLQ